MIHLCKLFALFLLLAMLASACFTSRESIDNSQVKYGIKNEATIKELATLAVTYALETNKHWFHTDTLPDLATRKKFKQSGYGGDVTVTFSNNNYRTLYGDIDSTVIFKNITLRGVLEIIYDFSAVKKNFTDDTSSSDYVLRRLTDRIYYRRRPFPLM